MHDIAQIKKWRKGFPRQSLHRYARSGEQRGTAGRTTTQNDIRLSLLSVQLLECTDIIKQIHFLVIGGWRLLIVYVYPRSWRTNNCPWYLLDVVANRRKQWQLRSLVTSAFRFLTWPVGRMCLPTSVICHTTKKVLPSLVDRPLLEDTAQSSLMILILKFPATFPATFPAISGKETEKVM